MVDASVAVKWFLPEIHCEAAGRVLKLKRELLAPDLIWAEVGNTLWKKVRRNEISPEEAAGILKDFLRFPIQTFGSKLLLDIACSLAGQCSVSVYDGLYLALAVSQKCSLVTADRKFYESMQKHKGMSVIWIEKVE